MQNIKNTLVLTLANLESPEPAILLLRDHLDLKLDLEIQDRIWFANILVNLIVIEDDLNRLMIYIQVCQRLVCNRDKFPDYCTQIEWYPLYTKLYQLLFPRKKEKWYNVQHISEALLNLVLHLNRQFCDNASVEILELILPRINPHGPNFVTFVKLLCQFLPTNCAFDRIHWIDTLFRIWDLNTDINELIFCLLERLVVDQHRYSNSVVFSQKYISLMFFRFMKSLSLPVGSGESGIDKNTHFSAKGSDGFISKRQILSFATIVVYTYHASLNVRESFSTMIHALESFAHPLNTGKWTFSIACFCQGISNALLNHLYDQGKLQLGVSVHMPLNFANQLVKEIYVLTSLLVFAKDYSSRLVAQKSLKSLAWIDPYEIIPKFLESIYPSLSSVTESMRTYACIGSCTELAVPLLTRSHYENGPQDIMLLLNLTLPGLDSNDLVKTQHTLAFISTVFSFVPITSTTIAANDAEAIFKSQIQYWISEFLEKLFHFFSTLPERYGIDAKDDTFESKTLTSFAITCSILFSNLSSDYTDFVVLKLAKFVSENCIPSATKSIGKVISFLSTREPMKRLDAFVPMCIEAIKTELCEGATKNPHKVTLGSTLFPFGFASLGDAKLHWYQYILLKVITDSGKDILKYASALKEYFVFCMDKCHTFRSYKWNFKILRRLAQSLVTVYPINMSSFHLDDWKSATFQNEIFSQWGNTLDAKNIEWHIPNADEIHFASELTTFLYSLSADNLEMLMSSSDGDLDLLPKWICGLKNFFYTISPFLGRDERFTDAGSSPFFLGLEKISLKETWCPSSEILTSYKVLAENARRELARTCSFVMENKPDDLVSILGLIKCILVHISLSGLQSESVDILKMRHVMLKSLMRKSKKDKNLPRYLLVLKANIVQLLRAKNAAQTIPTTESISALADILLSFSMSKYTIVRKKAQFTLSIVLKYHKSLCIGVIMKTLKSLQLEKDGDSIKGCLFLLQLKPISDICFSNISIAHSCQNVLLSLYTEQKPSVLSNLKKIHQEFVRQFSCVRPKISDKIKNLLPRNFLVPQNRIDQINHCVQTLQTNSDQFVNAAEIYSQLFHRQLADTDTLSFFIDGMIDEHPQLRVEYSRIVTQNLIALKDMHPRNSKMIVPCNSETISAILKPFGDIVNVLFHDPNIGYLCWSKDLKLSMSSGQSLMKVENDIFTLLYDKFSDGSFWKTLVKFYSEERGAGLDLFSTRNADFFKRIFYFCDRKIVLPYIIALCDGDDSFRQLAASEMLAGMIRSVSNEPLDERNHYMSIFKEIIWNCMANSTTQSQLYWGELLNFISKKRDPRCVWPIIERFFVGFSASDISQSFAQDSKRLFAMHVLLKAFNWRLGDLVDRCFMETLNIISSPFEQIRELAARILHTCIHIASNPGYLNVDELLKAKTIESSKSLELQQLLLTSYLKDNGKSSQKTVYCWFAYMLQSSKNIANFPVNEFLGSVLEFGDDQDADLQLMSLALSKMYPNLLHSDEMTQKLVDKLGTIIFSSNVGKKDWQKKIRCLNIIQVVYFRNVHVFSNEDQLKLLKYVLLMLQDANADVKRLASITLSGLVRCSLRGRVNELLAEFRRKLTANSKTAGFNISERQGIMLGFSSLVSAFPYHVPDWMPGVLIEMARYASNPSAVSSIVCSTFAEFKRTHQDSWEIDKRAFTEEQLYTISEFLLPTSYYA